MSEAGQRKLAKARRPTIPLTGAENVMLVDIGRVQHYGIQYFLLRDNINAIFGERVAQSKKLRKEKLKNIVKYAIRALMHDNKINKDNMTLDSFINLTRELIIALKNQVEQEKRRSASDNSLRKEIRELGKMESSPENMEVMMKETGIKRTKGESRQPAAAAAADVAGPYRPAAADVAGPSRPAAADVAGPSRPAAAVIAAQIAAEAVAIDAVPAPRSDNDSDKGKSKKSKVDPLAHQIDFLTNLMRQTTDSAFYTRTGLVNSEQPRLRRPHEEIHSNPFTSRVVRSGFNAALQQDREAVAREQNAAEEARRTEALRHMRQGMKDITDMFGKSKM